MRDRNVLPWGVRSELYQSDVLRLRELAVSPWLAMEVLYEGTYYFDGGWGDVVSCAVGVGGKGLLSRTWVVVGVVVTNNRFRSVRETQEITLFCSEGVGCSYCSSLLRRTCYKTTKSGSGLQHVIRGRPLEVPPR